MAVGPCTVHQVAVPVAQVAGIVHSDEEGSDDEVIVEPAVVSTSCAEQLGAGKKCKCTDALSKLSTEMDAFINTDHLPATDKRRHCRCKVLGMHYGNNRISKSHAVVICVDQI